MRTKFVSNFDIPVSIHLIRCDFMYPHKLEHYNNICSCHCDQNNSCCDMRKGIVN